MFYCNYPLTLTCDSGATSSLIKDSVARKIQAPVRSTSHTASQADGRTSLKATGEVQISVTHDCYKFILQAVVVKDLGCDVLVGMPYEAK